MSPASSSAAGSLPVAGLEGRWVARLPLAQSATLAGLRLTADVEGLVEQQHQLWLRGPVLSQFLAARLRSCPGLQLYQPDSQGILWQHGSRLPAGTEPAGSWKPVARLFSLELPAAAFAARVDSAVPLRLARGGSPGTAGMLRANWSDWATFALAAATARLDALAFAVGPAGAMLIRGTPLPPVPGEQLVVSLGLAVPCGWQFVPPVSPAVVRDLLQLDSDELAVFTTDGQYDSLREEHFVQASRSAVRQTQQQLRARDSRPGATA